MRTIAAVVINAVVASTLSAQAQTPLTIHRTVLDTAAGVLTVSGTGLGRDVTVLVDGQPASVLPGATATELQVQMPRRLLETPGTYRLAVGDAGGQTGDTLVVVVEHAARLVGARSAASGSSSAGLQVAPSSAAAATVFTPNATLLDASAPAPRLLEDDQNTAFGWFALVENYGIHNVAIGHESLTNNRGSSHNTALGGFALHQNYSGNYNTASGWRALTGNYFGEANTAVGAEALSGNDYGNLNTAVGRYALYNNGSANENVAIGANTLPANSASFNTAIGSSALNRNFTGARNTAGGRAALYWNSTASDNTALGFDALYSSTTGSANTALGSYAMLFNTIGTENTATGYQALYSASTGQRNTAAGAYTLLFNGAGSDNVALGYNAGRDATTGSSNVFVGANVAGTAADSNTMRLGLPYDVTTGMGQNRTFVAGVAGTVLTTPAVQVFVDANGQLGTLVPAPFTGTISAPLNTQPPVSAAEVAALGALVQQQQRTIAELQTALAAYRARLSALERAARPR